MAVSYQLGLTASIYVSCICETLETSCHFHSGENIVVVSNIFPIHYKTAVTRFSSETLSLAMCLVVSTRKTCSCS
jgi:hypothetical protein